MTSIANNSRLSRDRQAAWSHSQTGLRCWGWIASMALDMYGPMTGCSAWMMTSNWDFTHQALLFAMWAVMMTGMMLPSAAPAVFLYASVTRRNAESEHVLPRMFAFAAGYVTAWIVFSLAATALQLALTMASLLSFNGNTQPLVGCWTSSRCGRVPVFPVEMELPEMLPTAD